MKRDTDHAALAAPTYYSYEYYVLVPRKAFGNIFKFDSKFDNRGPEPTAHLTCTTPEVLESELISSREAVSHTQIFLR